MKFLRLSPVALSLIALLLVVAAPSLHAGASNKNGNPFGNGTFFSGNQTFSAILRSSNGFLGALQFTTAFSNSTVSSSTNVGVATVYANGEQFIGSAFGVVDPNASQIAVTYNGNTTPQTFSLPTVNNQLSSYFGGTYITGYDTNGNPVYSDYNRTQVQQNFGLTNFSTTNNLSGQFSASLKNSYPVQTFSGQGVANVFFQQPGYYLTNQNILNFIGNDASNNPIYTTNTYSIYVYQVNATNLDYTTQVIGSSLSAQ